MTNPISIDTRTMVRFWLVPTGLALAGFAVYSARTALIILGGALFLAIALNGPVNAIARHIRGNSRLLATTVAFISMIIILGGIIFLAVPPIIHQTTKLVESVPTLVRSVSDHSAWVNSLIQRYNLQPQVDHAVQSLQSNSVKWATDLGSNLLNSASGLVSVLTAGFLLLVLTFLILLEGPHWKRRLWSLYQNRSRREVHHRLANQMQGVIASYVNGQLTVSAIGGLASGLAVFVISWFALGVDATLALPTIAIAFIASLIPMFGATIGGIVVALLLLVSGVWPAIIYLIFFIIYQQIENNFISPVIQAKKIALSPLAVLVALTIGLYVFGLLGGIISIPIAGCIKVLVDEFLTAHTTKHTAQPSPETAE